MFLFLVNIYIGWLTDFNDMTTQQILFYLDVRELRSLYIQIYIFNLVVSEECLFLWMVHRIWKNY